MIIQIEISNLLYVADMMGVAVFAITGGLIAARQRMDIFGFIVLAIATGVGGGTMRDLLLGIRPVFWIADPNYLLVPVVAGIVVFFFAPVFKRLPRALSWLDAAGLAIFSVVGAGWAIRVGASFSVTVMMGVMTGVGGGLMRDILAGEPPMVLRREIYATAALLGAATYALLRSVELDAGAAMALGAGVTFTVRGLAIYFNLSYPVYGTTRFHRKDDS